MATWNFYFLLVFSSRAHGSSAFFSSTKDLTEAVNNLAGPMETYCTVVVLSPSTGDVEGIERAIAQMPARFTAGIGGEEARSVAPVMLVPHLTHGMLSTSRCSRVVLPTESVHRLSEMAALISDSASKAELVVLTKSQHLLDGASNQTRRATFDISLVVYGISDGNHTDGKLQTRNHLVKRNPAWREVRVAYWPGDLWMRRTPDGTFAGNNYELMKEFARAVPGGGIKLRLDKPKSFNGMMQRVKDGSSDLTVSQATFTYGRFKTAGDVAAFMSDHFLFMVSRHPKEVPADWTLLRPFDGLTWLATAASVAALTAVLSAARQVFADANTGALEGLYRTAMTALSPVWFQALPDSWFAIRFQSRSVLLLLCTWLLLSPLISYAYKSFLLSSLVWVDTDNPPDSWREVLDSDMTFFLPRGFVMENLMRSSPRDVVRQVYERSVLGKNGFIDSSSVSSSPAAIQKKILNGEASRIYSDKSLSGKRHLFIRGELLTQSLIGIYHVKKFPWKAELNRVIERLREGGVLTQMLEIVKYKWAKSERDNERQRKNGSLKQLSLRHFQLTWIVLVTGVVVAGLILASELFMAKKSCKEEKNISYH